MKAVGLWLLALAFQVRSETSLTITLDQKKIDITSHDEYIFGRYLDSEKTTCELAVKVINALKNSFNQDLVSALTATKKLVTEVQNIAEGTIAETCVKENSQFLQSSIAEEVVNFKGCATTATSALREKAAVLGSDSTHYKKKRDKALNDLNKCQKLFPSKQLQKARDYCINRIFNNFMKEGGMIANKYLLSPCMQSFKEKVVKECITKSTDIIILKSNVFWVNVKNCSGLDKDSDVTQISTNKNLFTSERTVYEQMQFAEDKYSTLNKKIIDELESYYKKENEAKKKYATGSFSQQYFRDKLTHTMAKYYSTINETLSDNPSIEDTKCGKDAKAAIDATISKGSKEQMTCDKKAHDDALKDMKEIRIKFSNINKEFAEVGYVAILNCLIEKYIFENDIIQECYDLKYRKFNLKWNSVINEVEEILKKFQKNIVIYTDLPSSPIPCGEEHHQNLILSADEILYKYKKCMYQQSGTDYDVTVRPTIEPPRITTPVPTKKPRPSRE